MLVTLTSAQQAEHTPPLVGADDSRYVMRVQLSPDEHLVLTRSWAPFEPIDRQRASALLRLAAAAQRARGLEPGGRLRRIKSGERLWFRLARPEDADRLAAMHDRSSSDSLYLRYHGASELGDVALRRLAGGHRGATIVAMNRDGLLVAAGHVFPLDDQTAEIAMLVEDDYQHVGVGAELLGQLLDLADDLGFVMVRADVIGENQPMLTLLERTGLRWHKNIENGVIEHSARLDGRPLP
jgi:GNAT superfamily N-acetyltransferase